MTVAIAKWTVEEYLQLVRTGLLDEKPVELLAGDFVEMAPEGPLHSSRIKKSSRVLRKVVPPEFEVSEAHPITLARSVPEPDLAIVVLDETNENDFRHPNASETKLVIEFAMSSLDKDLGPKRSLYAEAGIPEYWVVDLAEDVGDRRVIVLTEPKDGDYAQEEILKAGMVRSRMLPGVEIAASILLGN
ncbi:MAG: Uma2 family endonuclease [Cyanophyceae cyanobacterium]